MDFKKDKEYLSDIEKKLYKKDSNFSYKRQTLKPKELDVKSEWESKKKETAKKKKKIIQSSLLVKLFFLSLLFFIFSAGIASYRLFVNPVISSPKNVEILIQAPASVTGGEEVQIQVIVTNNNKTTIEKSTLEIEYPEGTDLVDIPKQDNKKFKKELGVILPGQKITETFRVTMFGEENTEKKFNINLEYRMEESSATFSKNKEYAFILTTSPVSISLDIQNEVNVGEEVGISINTVSNSNDVLKDFQIFVEYPFGFSFSGANPRPTKDDNIWYIGDITPSQKISIKIVGTMEGEVDEIKTFKIFVGRRSEKDSSKIDVVYNSIIKTIHIKKPFLSINFSINNDVVSDEVVVSGDEKIVGKINWQNNLSSQISNGEFILTISGPIVDESSISVSRGFYQSSNNSIIWNQVTDRSLGLIEPGETGSGNFTFKTKSLFGTGGSQFRNPEIILTLNFKGERSSLGFENNVITFSQSKKLRVNSSVQLVAYGRYFTGVFTNTGPIPPRVDKKTTYTITWAITNSANNISNAQVIASLPIYVKWLDIISPKDKNIIFNDTTGDIIWNIGSISQGSQKEISFQIELTPSLSQVKSSPVLVNESQFTGVDTFTNADITAQSSKINTSLYQDPLFDSREDSVVLP